MFGLSLTHLFWLVIIIIALNWSTFWPAMKRAGRAFMGHKVEAAPRYRPYMPPDSVDLCYKILGVSPSAAWDDIERAYRAKAKIHHPDHGGDEDAMRALNDAYRHLKRVRGR